MLKVVLGDDMNSWGVLLGSKIGYGSTRRLVAWALAIYVVVSGGIVAGLLLQLRADTIASGETRARAFGQIAGEQASQALSSVKWALQDAEESLSAETAAGTASEDRMRVAFRQILKDRPFARAIWVLDESGRIVYDSDVGNIGISLADRQYFLDQRDHPTLGLNVGAPFTSRSTGTVSIPVSLPWRRSDGKFSGAIVSAVDPQYFENTWTLDNELSDFGIALVRDDGTLLARAPLEERLGVYSFSNGPVIAQLRAGRDVGTQQIVRGFDKQHRLLSYRRLAAFPGLVVVVGQSMDSVLATWWRWAWILTTAWIIGSTAIIWLTLKLARSWTTQRATERQLRLLFEASPYPVYVNDLRTLRLLAVSDEAARLHGWSREELLAMTLDDVYPPEDRPAAVARRKTQIAENEAQIIQGLRLRRKDGSVFEAEMTVRVIEYDGRPANLMIAIDVSRRLQAERERQAALEQLSQSQANYRVLFDANPYPTTVADRETMRIVGVNLAAERLYGWSQAKFLTMTVDDLYLPEDAPTMRVRRDGSLADTSNAITGKRHRTKGGKVIDVEMASQVIKYDGRPANLTIITDVSERLRAEKAREAAEHRYRQLFDASPYPTYVVDRESLQILAVNDEGVRLFGWSREQFLTMKANDIYPPEEVPAAIDRRKGFTTTETQIIRDLRFSRSDGTVFEGELAVRFIEFMDKPANLAMVTDITERVQAERARRDAEERSRLLFQASPYPIYVSDRETLRILVISDEATRMQGWSRDEFLTMTVEDLYPAEDREAAALRRTSFSSKETQVVRGLRYRRKDGSIFDVEIAVRVIEYFGRPATLAMVMDVTERLRAEQARQVAEDQLRQSQKMEAVGQLTGGIAHDFNNILAVIIANAEALREEEVLDPGVMNHIDSIASAVERAADLTRSLLAFSRKQLLRPVPTVLNELVTATGKLLRRTLGAQIEIEFILADDLWTVDVDRSQLESALINLCVNARDAMPRGGRLLIETKNVTLDEKFVAQHLEAVAGEYVLLTVSDTGNGMPPDVAAKVFEPFFTTKEVGKGTGLGLSMVYGFVRQSQGHIAVESEVGRGTSFKLFLPRGQQKLTVSHSGEKRPAARGTEHILVVEDDPDVRAGVVRQLESLGYAVANAPDGAAGLVALEAATLPFDLLLTDVVMPGPLNGKALADEAARRWPATKVILMSGYTDDALTENGQLDTGVLLLSKPFRKADLAEMVRQALGGSAGSGLRFSPSAESTLLSGSTS